MIGSGGLKSFAVGAAIALAALLAGCGGGGGGDPGGDAPPVPLALMVDSAGRQLPEAEFGQGDALAAGADGIAFDGAPLGNAAVTLTDGGGTARTTTTDALGYYRLDIKGLRAPFVVKVQRAGGTDLFSASGSAPVARGFVPININGLTDKTLGFVADALNIGGGAASAVTAPVLASNVTQLDAAKVKLRTGLAVPLANAGLDAASYDPVTTSMTPANADKHAAFLRGLVFSRNAAGRVAVIGTVTGSARQVIPMSVAVDAAGNQYVLDLEAGSIRKISPAGTESTLATFTSAAGSALPFFPRALAVDGAGNVFASDVSNYAVHKVTPEGVVSVLAGGTGIGFADGAGSAAKFNFPTELAADRSGNVYVVDALNYSVRKITPAGVVTTIAGYTPQFPKPATAQPVIAPRAIAVDGAGNVYYGDLLRRAIVKVPPGLSGTDVYRAPDGFSFAPDFLAVDDAGTIYVANGRQVLRIVPPGAASVLAGATEYGSADGNGTSARFGDIEGVALQPDGSLLVADMQNQALRRITPGGEVTTVMGKKAAGFVDGPAASASFSGQLASSALDGFLGIRGVAVDSVGDIFLADTGNHAIRRIARSGAVTTVAGNGAPGFVNGNGRSASFNAPVGVAVDSLGNVYVADKDNNAVRKISPSGDVSTLAGSAVAGSADGVGQAATFDKPTDIAVGADGTVYVSDGTKSIFPQDKRAIRRITAAGVVSTLLADDALPAVPNRTPSFGPLAVAPGGAVLAKTYVSALACDLCADRNPIGGVIAISPEGVVTQRVSNTSPPSTTRNALAADREGNVYELQARQAGTPTMKLVRHSPAGVTTVIATDVIPALFDDGGRIALDADGNVVVVDVTSSSIRIVLP